MQTNQTSNAGAPHAVSRALSLDNAPAQVDEDGITRGLDKVMLYSGLHGLVRAHLKPLADLAQKHRVAFGIRPVNRFATQLIELGHPTKGLNIKGKTADWGPMAGFIPVLQKFSKLAGQPDRIARSDKEVETCIKDGYARSLPLTVGINRLGTLVEQRVIRIDGALGDQDIQILSTKDGTEHVFDGKLTVTNGVADYAISHEKAPVLVLAAMDTAITTPAAMTADYDVLFLGVPLRNFDNRDKARPSPVNRNKEKPLIQQFFANVADGYDTAALSNEVRSATDDHSPHAGDAVAMSPRDHGESSARMDEFIPHMNTAIGRSDANPVIQHGADTQNPYSVFSENFPSVIFAAQLDKDSPEVVMIEDRDAAIKVFTELKAKNFQFFGNKNWAAEMPRESIRRPSYNVAFELIKSVTESPMSSPRLTKIFGRAKIKTD